MPRHSLLRQAEQVNAKIQALVKETLAEAQPERGMSRPQPPVNPAIKQI